MNNDEKQIHLRLDNSEYEEMMRKIDFLGFRYYSSMIRMFIRYGLCISVDFDPFYENATQISRVGNSINQIARAVNSTHDVTPEQIELLQKHMARLDKIFNDFTNDKIKLIEYTSIYYPLNNDYLN